MGDPLQDLAGFLRGVEAFAALDDTDRGHLASAAEVVRGAADSVVFAEGDPADAMFVVVYGQVRVERVAPDGARVELAAIGPRGVFGEMALYEEGTRRSATVRVGNRTTVMLSLRREAFVALLRDHVEIALHLLAAQSRRMRDANDRLITVDHAARKHAPSFDEQVTDDFPHPIAQVFQDANALTDPRPRLQRFIELFEVSLLYTSAMARALYLHTGQYSPEIDRDLYLGAKGQTLGQHIRAVRTVSRHLVEGHGQGGFAASLYAWVVARKGNRQASLERIDRLLEIRNELKHGAEGTLDAVAINGILGEFEPRLRDLLASMTFLCDHPPVYLHAMNFVEGTFRYGAQRCRGAFRTFRSEAFDHPTPRELDRLYLQDGDGLVPLFPFMGMYRCDTCGDRDIFFGRSIFPNRVELIEFERGHSQQLSPIPASVAASLEGCRERVRGTDFDLR